MPPKRLQSKSSFLEASERICPSSGQSWTPIDKVDDSVIRAIVSPRQQIMNQGQEYTDYGGQIGKSLGDITARAVSDVGITAGALAYLTAMNVVRQALPMVLALLKMAIVICLPLIFVIGTYELKVVVTVSVVEFALFFTDFWFQLAQWIDSTILDALYGWNSPHANFNPLMGINNTFGDLLLQYVLGTMFLVLPALWVTALAWTGFWAGNFLQGLANGTRASGEAGGQGTSVLMKVAAE